MNRKGLSERIGKVQLKEESHLYRYFNMRLNVRTTCLRGLRTTKAQNSLISAYVIRLLESIISRLAVSDISIFYLVSVAEETGLSLALSEIPKTSIVTMRPIREWSP